MFLNPVWKVTRNPNDLLSTTNNFAEKKTVEMNTDIFVRKDRGLKFALSNTWNKSNDALNGRGNIRRRNKELDAKSHIPCRAFRRRLNER